MCIRDRLEDTVTPGCNVLDVGTGSGILAVCASKLGAADCRAYDIDPVAVEVAAENAAENGCANVTVGQSDLLAGVAPGKYDVVCANIVADIIIRMAPDIGRFMHDESTLLASGIINERASDVIDALEALSLIHILITAKIFLWSRISARPSKTAKRPSMRSITSAT